jgi:type VI secretion system protein ImpC
MSTNIQKRIGKTRSPRVQITYDLEIGDAVETVELAMKAGIIGDFSGTRDESKEFSNYKERKFIGLDADNFDEVLKSMTPRVLVVLPAIGKNESRSIEIIFESMNDFHPSNIVKKTDFLFALYEEKRKLVDLRMKHDLNSKISEFLDKIMMDSSYRETIKSQIATGNSEELNNTLESLHFCHSEQTTYAYELISNYLSVIENNSNPSINGFITLNITRIADIDTELALYLNAILLDPKFKQLEGSWRGVAYFLANADLSSNTQVRIFNASEDELFDDLTKAMEFDQSALFKKVYEEEYGTFGGTPFTAMIWDHHLGRTSKDFILLRKITEVMAAAHCPIFIGTSASLFDLKSFENLHQPTSITKIFASVELAEFRGFKESPDSKYATLVLPRVMARMPYNTNDLPIEGLNYVEKVSGLVSEEYTWMNAVYAYLTQVATAYSNYGWFSSICGVENGGKVDNLPLHIYKSLNGDILAKCPTEVAITDRREKELSDLGFIALCNAKDEDYSVFFGSNSAFKPPVFSTDFANANGQLSSRTPYMLNVSRFAHYLKCIMRDKVGSFSSREGVAMFLSNWLGKYTLLDDKASANLKSKYPLREFAVTVEEVPGKPGNYKSVILLRPHDEMQAIEMSLRLVAGLPK